VRDEVIRLKALMPAASVRTIATTFNTLWCEKRGETVGKTFVAGVIRAHELDIVRKRAEIKNRRPWPMARNLVWALDLSYLPDIEQKPTPILGLIDHGSRACLVLRERQTKTTIAVLRVLLDAIEDYGRPRAIRTDNEATFTSFLFRLALAVFGIRHQRTTPGCPWQSGRIERLFGTLKAPLRAWHAIAGVPDSLQQDLNEIRAWYNHVRPHMHLDGLTPAHAWPGTRPNPRKQAQFVVDEWDGLLAGYWFPP
jgi:transposase InsO family protein